MKRIKFVTDSAADIPKEYADRYGVQVLPFSIALDKKLILDGVDYSPEEFYQLLISADHIPSHAQLTMFEFEQCFDQALQEGYDALIYTSINSKGSSTYENAILAQQHFQKKHPTFDIRVIDSRSYSFDYGFPVVEAAKQALKGPVNVDVAEAMIRGWLDHSVILFAPYSLKFAQRSGRIPVAAAFAGDAFGIRPIMSFPNGESKVITKVRGNKKVVPALVKIASENREPGSPYLVIQGMSKAHNAEIMQACIAAFHMPPAVAYYIGGVIAINAGPELVGIIYQEKEK